MKPKDYSLECYKPPEEYVNDKKFVLNLACTAPRREYAGIRFASMFYHSEKAFSLLEEYMKNNNIKESDIGWVFKMRTDFIPSTDIVLPSNPEPNTVYIPESMYHYKPCPHDWVPDQVACGTFDTMKKYCSLYSRIIPEDLELVIPERTLYHHLKHKKLTWTWAPCEYTIDGRRFINDCYN